MTPREVYDDLADAFLTREGVTVGRSLHNETLTVGGKIFGFLKDDRLVVKIPAAEVAALVGDGRAVPFTAGGRTMREWAMLSLPAADGAEIWRAWLDAAYAFVGRP